MTCSHLEEAEATLQPPKLSQQVHREECTLCFDGQDDPQGVLVCLTCFNGGCFGEGRRHAYLHYEKTKHALGVTVKRTRKQPRNRDSQEPPLKKLAISAPSDEELCNYQTSLICFSCSPVGEAVKSDNPVVEGVIKGIMTSLSSSQRSEVKAWEEEIIACEHTLMLQQEPLVAPGEIPKQCSSCDLTANLWLCLTCGLANCGRQQFGGIGGNGHALNHFQQTGHMLGVKLGTITPEGTADIYCYACDDAKVDHDLAIHLSTFGIEVMSQSKTEKSMTELQLEQNMKFDFSMTGDDGKELLPVFGKGLTGLKNLGNSCYMASVLQTLFSLPAFRSRYTTPEAFTHFHTCSNPLPADCLECQMLKVGDGLMSGRYSHVAPRQLALYEGEEEVSSFQEGIRPSQFKALIGKGDPEFSTMRQQDSEEFLQHLFTRLRDESKRQSREEPSEPTSITKFAMEQRLQCGKCNRVGLQTEPVDLASLPMNAVEQGVNEDGKKLYKCIELSECLEALCGEEQVADYSCTNCGEKTVAHKSNKFKTFPDLLILHMRKFQLINWLPTKLEIPVSVPDILTLDTFLAKGLQPGEETLDVSAVTAPSLPEFNGTAMAQLEAMGFPSVRCQKALLATGNNDAEAAMGWLFEHMEDADIDAPIQPSAEYNAASNNPSDEQISMIADMGFNHKQARKALRESNGNAERAIEWLFSNPDDPGEDAASLSAPGPVEGTSEQSFGGSATLPARYRLKAFISHKGPSVHSGHYVATIRQPQSGVEGRGKNEDEWVLFNDEKVVVAPENGGEDMRKLAYLYVYEKI